MEFDHLLVSIDPGSYDPSDMVSLLVAYFSSIWFAHSSAGQQRGDQVYHVHSVTCHVLIVNSSLVGCLSLRLIRKICPQCDLDYFIRGDTPR